MEFEFTVPGLASQYISVWDAAAIGRLAPEHFDNLKEVLDVLGKRSAKAQGLGVPVTDIYRLRSTDQRLYLVATRPAGITTVHGGLKIGQKKLFLRNEAHALHELQPTCVLDFYVHETCQRQGLGKQLFQSFLETEQLHPGALAYDRPSPKLIAFLAKHFGLRDCMTQSNHYVIYSSFWQYNHPNHSSRAGGRYAARPVQPQRASVQPAAQVPLGTERQHIQQQALRSSLEAGHGHGSQPPDTALSSVSSQQHGYNTGTGEARYAQHEMAGGQQQQLGHSMHSTSSMHSNSMEGAPGQTASAGLYQTGASTSYGAGLQHRDSIDNFRMLTYGTSLDNQLQPSAKLPFNQPGAGLSSAGPASLDYNRLGVYVAGIPPAGCSTASKQGMYVPGLAAAGGAPSGPSVVGSIHTVQGPATLYKAAVAPRASMALPHQGNSIPDAYKHPDQMQLSARQPGPSRHVSSTWDTTSSTSMVTKPYNSDHRSNGAPQLSSRAEGTSAGQLQSSRSAMSHSLGGPQWVRPPWGSDNDQPAYRPHLNSASSKPAVGQCSLQTGMHQAASYMQGTKQASMLSGASRMGSCQGLGSQASGANMQAPGGHARVLAAASRSGAGAAGCLSW